MDIKTPKGQPRIGCLDLASQDKTEVIWVWSAPDSEDEEENPTSYTTSHVGETPASSKPSGGE